METSTPQRARHTRETLRIQRRLERAELEHLREVVATQGQQIEQLQHDLACAEDQAIFWSRMHDLEQDLRAEGSNAAIGLTHAGEVGIVQGSAA